MSTKINWAANPDGSKGETINPVRGFCEPISPGCAHCCARRMAGRLKRMGMPGYQSTTEAKLAAALARAEKAEGQRDALAAAMRRCLDGQCTPGYAACRDALAKL